MHGRRKRTLNINIDETLEVQNLGSNTRNHGEKMHVTQYDVFTYVALQMSRALTQGLQTLPILPISPSTKTDGLFGKTKTHPPG